MKRILGITVCMFCAYVALGQGSKKFSNLTHTGSIDAGISILCVDSNGAGFMDELIAWNTLLTNVGYYVFGLPGFRDSIQLYSLTGDGSMYQLAVYSGNTTLMSSNISDSTSINHTTISDTLKVNGQIKLGCVGLASYADSPLVLGLNKKDIRKVNPPVGINGVVFKWPGDTVSMDSTYGCIWTDTLWGRNLLATKSWANSQGFLKTANLSGYLTATTSATTLITGTSTMTVGKLGNGYAIGGVSMQLGSDATGDIYYNSSGVLTRLAAGTNGQMLSLAGGVPVWVWPSFSQFNDQSGTSYTLVLGDANQWVTSNNSSAVTFTVPPNSSVAFATGTVIQFINKGAGKLTFSPGSGVTINQPSSYLSLVQGQGGFLVKTATNTWYVFGGVSN